MPSGPVVVLASLLMHRLCEFVRRVILVGGDSATFEVNRSDDGSRIETEVRLGEERKLQRVLSYENAGEAALVGIELEILGHDRVYEEAILAAGEIVKSF